MGIDYSFGTLNSEVRGMLNYSVTDLALIHLVLELQPSIEFSPDFTATYLLHPATYLNKVLVASNEGSMQLWNIRTQLVR